MRRIHRSASTTHRCVYITTEPLVRIKSILDSEECILFRKIKSSGVPQNENKQFYQLAKLSIETLNHEVDFESATNDISSIVFALENAKIKPDVLIIWNGQQILGRALGFYAKKYAIKTRYLELSNLPGKLFCDPVGVNALSSLAKNVNILDTYPTVSDEVNEFWVEEYIQEKEKPLPQSVKNNFHLIESLLNRFLKKIFRGVGKSSFLLSELVNPKKKVSFTKIMVTNFPLESFLFLPLQVSNDTQIKLHSDIDNLQAIIKAHEYCLIKHIKLVVKFHPAETSQIQVDCVRKLQQELSFVVSDENTVDLIKSATEVATINSTVGLEAMIFGKPVCVYGTALYKNFTKRQLNQYIHSYLIDGVNPFSNKEIDVSSMKRIIG